MAYATPADLLLRYDERTVLDLASDTQEPASDAATDTVILAALEDASGQVEAAVLVGSMYQTTDLTALTGNGLAMLKRIVCDIAMALLMQRRPEKWNDATDRMLDRCEAYLEQIRGGARVFGVTANQEAGLPTIDGPTAVELDQLRLITSRVKNFYPSVAQRLPDGRG